MTMESLGHKAATGAVWATIDRFGYMALQFGVNLILSRLLTPEDFGIIGMLAIFIAVSQVLIDSGFGSALIQKKNPTQTDYSTIFFWNIGFSLILYFILFLSSPLVAIYFSMPILSDVLRIIGLNLIVTSIMSIQMTRLRKELAFKKIAITNIVSYVFSSLIAIVMAYHGLGVWSLVVMQLFGSITAITILWIITKWHPKLCFSKSTMRELFSFGGYIMAAGILQEFCKNLQGIIIGKKFSATQMGYFSQAYKLDQVSSYSIPQVIIQVMYPVYSSIQDDKMKLVDILSMNIRVLSFLIFPLIGLLILIAEPLIMWLYGEKWLPSIPYFQILCFGGFFVCLQNVNFYAVAAVGKSKTLFYWSFYKWGFLLSALLIGMNFGMYGILWGMVLSSINIYVVNAALVNEYLGMSIVRQLLLLLPIFVGTIVSLGVCIYAKSENINVLLLILMYFSIYIGFSLTFRLNAITDMCIILQKITKS